MCCGGTGARMRGRPAGRSPPGEAASGPDDRAGSPPSRGGTEANLHDGRAAHNTAHMHLAEGSARIAWPAAGSGGGT